METCLAMAVCYVLLLLGFCIAESSERRNTAYFLQDHLTPYSATRHGSGRIAREIADCQHVRWENRTFETLPIPRPSEVTDAKARFELHQFADTVEGAGSSLSRRYLIGTLAYLEQPYHTLSVLEPGHRGGCKVQYWSTTRSTVQDTASHRFGGCRLAVNAGYFNVRTGHCLGNIVSDGRIVQTSNDEQNANFGIRQDGTIIVGYIPDEEILNSTNPFRQLVAGVIWLVRNGTNFVNESMELECSSHEDTGRMETFVNVISARTALGHDAEGRVVIAQVNGQTHRRGANLHEFADLLVRHGIVNAINLDGGGSSTLVQEQVLINYPSDHCGGSPEYRCERPVSTIICVHNVQCLEPQCSGHGSCDLGVCSCDSPWIGEGCERLNCSLTDCSVHGSCLDGVCQCAAGWMGEFCNQTCPSGRYGDNCQLTCYCYGRSKCDPIKGTCICPPGYRGYGCWQECEAGHYGQDCLHMCQCSEHGSCSPINGSCSCEDGWEGTSCNDSMPATATSPGSMPTPISTTTNRASENRPTTATISPEGPPSTWTTGLPHTLFQEPSTAEVPLTVHSQQHQSSTTCDASQRVLSVAMVIGMGFASVLLHLLVCWVCQRRYESRAFQEHFRTRQPTRLKRRKLRKKPPFMRIPVHSSSDCSI